MIRTTISLCLLFGCLLVVSKAVHQSPTQDRQAARVDNALVQDLNEPVAPNTKDYSATARRANHAVPRAFASDEGAQPLPIEQCGTDEPAALASDAIEALPPILLTPPEVDHAAEVITVSASTSGPLLLAPPNARTEATAETGAAAEAKRKASSRREPATPRPVITSVRDKSRKAADRNMAEADESPAAEAPALDFFSAPDFEDKGPAAKDNPEFDETFAGSADGDAAVDGFVPADDRGAAPEENDHLEPGAGAPASPAAARPAREDAVVIEAQDYPTELEPLRQTVRDVLGHYLERRETMERRSPWGVMHAFIAYGVDTEVLSGGRRVNAIAYMCWNGPCRGQRLLATDRRGRLEARQGVGVQGHAGQFLAMLAQSKVKSDYPLRVDGHSFTVADLIRYEQETCKEKTELTFKLIGLVHYLDTEATWQSRDGQTWDLPRLIKEELAQPVVGSACGGTHRMMGFSYAVRKRERTGGAFEGQWLRAKKYVDSYHDYTFNLQNADGSFSTNWFRGPGSLGDLKRRLETTGHMLEWLVYSLPQEELTQPRVVKSVEYLANLLWENRDQELEVGPKGHALHALALYDERVFGGQPGQRRVELARHLTGEAR